VHRFTIKEGEGKEPALSTKRGIPVSGERGSPLESGKKRNTAGVSTAEEVIGFAKKTGFTSQKVYGKKRILDSKGQCRNIFPIRKADLLCGIGRPEESHGASCNASGHSLRG